MRQGHPKRRYPTTTQTTATSNFAVKTSSLTLTVKMGAARSTETSVSYHNPDDND
jgi:hypothetical protein